MSKMKLLWHRFAGKGFRVIFRKGERSPAMTYTEAVNYAMMFHGAVVPMDDRIRWRRAGH